MSEPTTAAGRAVPEQLRKARSAAEMGAVIRRAILAIEAEARAAALDEVRQYVQNNRDAWSDSDDMLSVATADIYQKVLNVIDTGNPMLQGDR